MGRSKPRWAASSSLSSAPGTSASASARARDSRCPPATPSSPTTASSRPSGGTRCRRRRRGASCASCRTSWSRSSRPRPRPSTAARRRTSTSGTGGQLVMKPGKAGTQEKTVPIEAFFRKIVAVRERLRVLEQRINTHPKLADEDRLQLQDYITRAYGSLTTFNVLFADAEDRFVGTKGSEDD